MVIGTNIFSPSETAQVSVAYCYVWVLVRSDNNKIHHWQQFGIEIHYLVVDSVSIVMTRPNSNQFISKQSLKPLTNFVIVAF